MTVKQKQLIIEKGGYVVGNLCTVIMALRNNYHLLFYIRKLLNFDNFLL